MSALFLHLLNRAIAAGWLVLAVVALRLVLRRAPRRIHCALWGLVGLRLIWPFSLPSVLSLLPSAETVSPEILYDSTPTIHSGVGVVNATVNPILSQTMAPTPGASVNPLQIYVAIAAALWLAGVAALLLYTAVSYWRIHRRIATAVMSERGVYQCGAITTPFLLGFIHPRIYLPFTMDPQQRPYVLAHEQAHLRRRDHWYKPLSWLLVCVFWFHPLLWLAYVLLGRDMELACDEAVIRAMNAEEKKCYSHALLSCSAPRRAIGACPLAFGEVGVKERIRAVLNYRKPALWLTMLAVVAAAVLAVCFLTDPLPPADPADPTLPAVTWSCSPAISATWGSAFYFDFGSLAYTHIEAACDTGELWNFSTGGHLSNATSLTLEHGLALCWSPYTDAASFQNTPDEATVTFTVYNGNRKLYTGTIHLTCTSRKDLTSTYEARMSGDLRILRDSLTPGAKVVTKTQYETAISPESIICSGVDLDHDGRSETVHVLPNEGGDRYHLFVVEDGSLLGSVYADLAHLNWNTVLLCRLDGQDYLMEYTPMMNMGYAYYNYKLFSLENGYQTKAVGEVNYVWPADVSAEMDDFADAANALMKDAQVLLSTQAGKLVVGPIPASEVSQIYPVNFAPAR